MYVLRYKVNLFTQINRVILKQKLKRVSFVANLLR